MTKKIDLHARPTDGQNSMFYMKAVNRLNEASQKLTDAMLLLAHHVTSPLNYMVYEGPDYTRRILRNTDLQQLDKLHEAHALLQAMSTALVVAAESDGPFDGKA